jgi:beta-lactamase superfamily II metal-dependent hydrolase
MCTMLFLFYIKGEEVQEWVQSQANWVFSYLNVGNETNKYIWDMTWQGFQRAFTNTMKDIDTATSIKELKMKGVDRLDTYIATFE